MSFDHLHTHMATAESSATDTQIEHIALLVGNFPLDHGVRISVSGKYPRIEALLTTAQPLATERFALLQLSSFINDANIVGHVAKTIRDILRP